VGLSGCPEHMIYLFFLEHLTRGEKYFYRYCMDLGYADNQASKELSYVRNLQSKKRDIK
jgi:hypothetical protein